MLAQLQHFHTHHLQLEREESAPLGTSKSVCNAYYLHRMIYGKASKVNRTWSIYLGVDVDVCMRTSVLIIVISIRSRGGGVTVRMTEVTVTFRIAASRRNMIATGLKVDVGPWANFASWKRWDGLGDDGWRTDCCGSVGSSKNTWEQVGNNQVSLVYYRIICFRESRSLKLVRCVWLLWYTSLLPRH